MSPGFLPHCAHSIHFPPLDSNYHHIPRDSHHDRNLRKIKFALSRFQWPLLPSELWIDVVILLKCANQIMLLGKTLISDQWNFNQQAHFPYWMNIKMTYVRRAFSPPQPLIIFIFSAIFILLSFKIHLFYKGWIQEKFEISLTIFIQKFKIRIHVKEIFILDMIKMKTLHWVLNGANDLNSYHSQCIPVPSYKKFFLSIV